MKYIKDERQNSILETARSGYTKKKYYKRSCKSYKREKNPDTFNCLQLGVTIAVSEPLVSPVQLVQYHGQNIYVHTTYIL